ncbi:MAG: TSCPD domain-containing protein [Magnetococcales bacterium]|nr:TSCPD domain-containing protein [Magnetococcales bacterium]NGZ07219.1 TSCPD domain-containing protein [Magnetococcales bacterium]
MTVKIQNKIVGYEVATKKTEEVAPVAEVESSPQEPVKSVAEVIQLQPVLRRPEDLEGSTYKIKTPLFEHAFYVTINDIVVNGRRRPFEIFINSKNMDNFAWIVALTRVMSAVFRHGGDATFLVEEMRSVFDPRGGYFKPGGKYMPSLVAEIGECIERHLIKIGMIQPAELPPDLAAKRQAVAERGGVGNAQCPKCGQFSVTRLDGCDTCLECGYSKCG